MISNRFPQYLTCIILALSLLNLPSTAYSAHHAKTTDPHTARLGVLLMNVPFQRLESLKLDYGVHVDRVIKGSPAEGAGLRVDDIIFEFDGKPIYSVNRLQWFVNKIQAGANVQLKYSRNGEFRTANAQFPTT